jgi:hypothetical protein
MKRFVFFLTNNEVKAQKKKKWVLSATAETKQSFKIEYFFSQENLCSSVLPQTCDDDLVAAEPMINTLT